MTWSRMPSYCCLHWVLNWAVVGLGWPLAGLGAAFCFSATHAAKSGGSGTLALAAWAPVWPADEIAATCIQWLNWVLVMDSSPTRATAFPGTLSPQAARETGRISAAASAVTVRSLGIGRARVAIRALSAPQRRSRGFARDGEQRIGGPHDRREALWPARRARAR